MTMNQRIEEMGIKTVRKGEQVFLEFQGKLIIRGSVDTVEDRIQEHFGISV